MRNLYQIRQKLKSQKLIYSMLPLYRLLKNYFTLFKRHPNMNEEELRLFRELYKDFKIVIDVGARYDIDYIKISSGNNIRYFLFEANPSFYYKLKQKLLTYQSEKIVVENIAIGSHEGKVDYYKDSESILQNTNAVKNSQKRLNQKIKIRRLDNYLDKLNINQIDFLKCDIEHYENSLNLFLLSLC